MGGGSGGEGGPVGVARAGRLGVGGWVVDIGRRVQLRWACGVCGPPIGVVCVVAWHSCDKRHRWRVSGWQW